MDSPEVEAMLKSASHLKVIIILSTGLDIHGTAAQQEPAHCNSCGVAFAMHPMHHYDCVSGKRISIYALAGGSLW